MKNKVKTYQTQEEQLSIDVEQPDYHPARKEVAQNKALSTFLKKIFSRLKR